MVGDKGSEAAEPMNSDHTHSSEIWAFFRTGSSCRNALGRCGFVYPKAVFSATVKHITSASGICFSCLKDSMMCALRQRWRKMHFQMLFAWLAIISQEGLLSRNDIVEPVCSTLRHCCAWFEQQKALPFPLLLQLSSDCGLSLSYAILVSRALKNFFKQF